MRCTKAGCIRGAATLAGDGIVQIDHWNIMPRHNHGSLVVQVDHASILLS
eukprot:SAG31_NODE_44106_length_264_cov_0.630303_1_plen_49_part_01